MVIRHSIQLLEQLSEVEEKIQVIERIMSELKIDYDQEVLIKALLARKLRALSGQ